MFRSDVGNVPSHHCARVVKDNRCLAAFVYLKCAGKRLWLTAFTWGSGRIDLGAVSPAVFWREACGWQKPLGIRHEMWGSDRIALGAASPAVFWREACGWQKPPGIRHGSSYRRAFMNSRIFSRKKLVVFYAHLTFQLVAEGCFFYWG
jgi:hypothetical protein